MLKEKWQKLRLREKVLLISGILVILSIPLSLITFYCMSISMTLFVVSVFYNLYKLMQRDNASISELIETNMQKGKKVSGADSTQYRFSNSKDGYIVFDSEGYIVDAKGFGSLVWSSGTIDKDLVGKHVDELAEMLKTNGASRDVYTDFEINVHLELLKQMLQNSKH